MSDDSPKAPLLLYTLAIALIAAAVQPMIQGNFVTARFIGTLIAAFLCIVFAYRWRSFNAAPSVIRAAAERVANDFSWWFAILASVWLYTVAMNVATEIRRNNETVALRNDVQSIATVLRRTVLPRHLTKDQQEMIVNFLTLFEPHEYAFRLPVGDDEETSVYRADIQEALTKAGWKLADTDPIVYVPNIDGGLNISLFQTQEHQAADLNNRDGNRDVRTPNSSKLLQEAFGLAGVRIEGTGGGSRPANMTQDRLVISIGHRRMDDYALVPPG